MAYQETYPIYEQKAIEVKCVAETAKLMGIDVNETFYLKILDKIYGKETANKIEEIKTITTNKQ